MGKKTGPKGPTKMTKETIQKLESAFSLGCTDPEACLYADISLSSLYDYQSRHPKFLDRKNILKKSLKLQSRLNVGKTIKNGDVENSKWYLERKAKDEFSTKQESGITDQKGNDVDMGEVISRALEKTYSK